MKQTNKTSEMDQIINLFLNGKYQDCLDKISNIECEENDQHVLENNSFMCKLSMLIVENIETQQNDCLNDILSWFDNLNRGPNVANILPILINIVTAAQCLVMSTSVRCSDALYKCLKNIDACAMRVLGVTASSSDKTESCMGCLKNLAKCLKHLSSIKSPILPLFGKLTAVTILHVIYSNPPHFSASNLLNIIDDTMSDFVEISSIIPFIHHQSYNNIFTLGWKLEPTLLGDDNIKQCMTFIALIGCVLGIGQPNIKRHSILDKTKHDWIELTNYIEGFHKFKIGDLTSALTLLIQTTSPLNSSTMQSRQRCLIGQIYSSLGEKEKAIDSFTLALKCDKLLAEAHYYKGLEFGKMGLQDLMLKSYHNLHTAIKKKTRKVCTAESILLDILHQPYNNISKTSSIYLLAVSYGLNDMVNESAMAFQKLFSAANICELIEAQHENVMIPVPPLAVILHEAAAMYLLNGDLSYAEDTINRAILAYPQRNSSKPSARDATHPIKDIQWLQNVLSNDMDVLPTPLHDHPVCNESYLSVFEEDVIGLLLLADLQRIQGVADARLTINQALLILSKYLAKMKTQENSKNETHTLVNALTAKTCLYIATMQSSARPFAEVDKMFRRALSTNRGDKDILYYYATFFVSHDKISDARKLWNTFFDKESIVHTDFTQSLALRYLLRNQVSYKQLASLSNKLQNKT